GYPQREAHPAGERLMAKQALSSRDGRMIVPVKRTRSIRGRYDAAQTTDENRRHRANADALSADAASQPEIRRRLANRCRYEVQNNSYAKGIGLTIANDTVGVGPQLNMLFRGRKRLAKFMEQEFWYWTEEIGLAEKL